MASGAGVAISATCGVWARACASSSAMWRRVVSAGTPRSMSLPPMPTRIASKRCVASSGARRASAPSAVSPFTPSFTTCQPVSDASCTGQAASGGTP